MTCRASVRPSPEPSVLTLCEALCASLEQVIHAVDGLREAIVLVNARVKRLEDLIRDGEKEALLALVKL